LPENEFIHCVLISCEENNGAGKGRVKEMMIQVRRGWGKGWCGGGAVEGNFLELKGGWGNMGVFLHRSLFRTC